MRKARATKAARAAADQAAAKNGTLVVETSRRVAPADLAARDQLLVRMLGVSTPKGAAR